jgi:hypothetical protein
VNRWNGAVEPRVVLRELYPRRDDAEPDDAAARWWDRFEAELARDPGAGASAEGAPVGSSRTECVTANSGAAVAAELASSGCGPVLAAVADTERRAPLAASGIHLADIFTLEAEPDLAGEFEHVVLVDPPASAWAAERFGLDDSDTGFIHVAWGEAERRFAISVLDHHFARRPALIALYRDLREAGECGGARLLEALGGRGTERRRPEVAARCFRVLADLGLVQGTPNRGAGTVGAVSSEETELDRSGAFCAYGDRHQECLRFLERRQR